MVLWDMSSPSPRMCTTSTQREMFAYYKLITLEPYEPSFEMPLLLPWDDDQILGR